MIPDVSVIVPVYNVEPYLCRCLNSLINQTKKEIEIILIDDGSPDNCGSICDEYSKKDERIRVIHQENKGLAEARNVGIEAALCDYIMFVDSDDFVSEDFCKEAFRLITEKKADLVLFGYYDIIEGKIVNYRHRKRYSSDGYKTIIEAQELIIYNVGSAAWSKIYRKELFNGIKYPIGRAYEDVATTFQLVFQAKCIWFSNTKLYYYNHREGSIVQTNTRKNHKDHHEMRLFKAKQLIKHPETRVLGYILLFNSYLDYCIYFPYEYTDMYYIEAEKALMSIKKTFMTCTQAHLLRIFYTWKKRILILLFWYSRSLFDYICVITNHRIKEK